MSLDSLQSTEYNSSAGALLPFTDAQASLTGPCRSPEVPMHKDVRGARSTRKVGRSGEASVPRHSSTHGGAGHMVKSNVEKSFRMAGANRVMGSGPKYGGRSNRSIPFGPR
ncbi:MAG: hypothetical protein EPO08_21225 [Rhodospirillaceae bacterium]|nr:MAG: hypothetical protein EPO08_21225 [Rhodospirillaceae bacterium]